MPFLLPPDISLRTESSATAVWKDGQLVLQMDLSYPQLHVLNKDIPGNDYNGYDAVKMPVVMTEEGPVTDWAWKAFVELEVVPSRNGRPAVETAYLRKAIEGIAKGTLAWNMTCSAMPQSESLIGRLFEVFEDQYGFMSPLDRPSDVISEMKISPAELFKHIKPADLRTFRDRGRSLLDMATTHGLWDLSEWLFKQGVPLSPETVDAGLVHQALVLTQNASDHSQEELTHRSAWLDRWLTRLESFPLPSGGLDWERRHRQHRMSSVEASDYTDSVASFWATKQVNWFGPSPSLPQQLNPNEKVQFERWVQHWTTLGLDLDTVQMPTRYDPYKEKPISVPLTEHWTEKTAPWLERTQTLQSPLKRQKALNASLPSVASTRQKGPRF